MNNERFRNEFNQLIKLKSLLENDAILPLRFDIERLTLEGKKFKLVISGITCLVNNPEQTARTFTLTVEVPSGYPNTAIPNIKFQDCIPFHPHIFPGGSICWGTGSVPQPDLILADWIRGVVEYLQYNQDRGSMLKINHDSPANRDARDWWQRNKRNISHYIPPIDMNRLRFWINQSRG